VRMIGGEGGTETMPGGMASSWPVLCRVSFLAFSLFLTPWVPAGDGVAVMHQGDGRGYHEHRLRARFFFRSALCDVCGHSVRSLWSKVRRLAGMVGRKPHHHVSHGSHAHAGTRRQSLECTICHRRRHKSCSAAKLPSCVSDI
jgi:hypothetical protein